MLSINKIPNKRYISDFGYPRPKNIFAESLIELDDALRNSFTGYFSNATVKLENHYRRVNSSSNIFNFELRQIVPKLYKPFSEFAYYSKPLPVDIRVAQLESKVRSRNSVAGLFKMANGEYGFIALKLSEFALTLEDKSIKSVGKIRNEQISEIVFISPKEGAVDENFIERYRIVLPNEKIEVTDYTEEYDGEEYIHRLTRKYDNSKITCDSHGEKCDAIDFVAKMENFGIELGMSMGPNRLIMQNNKVRSALKLKINRKLSEEGPAIKHKKSKDHKERQDRVLFNVLDIYGIGDQLTESNKTEMLTQLDQEIKKLIKKDHLLNESLHRDLNSLFNVVDSSIKELNKLAPVRKTSAYLEETLRTLTNYTESRASSDLSLDQMVLLLDLNSVEELGEMLDLDIDPDDPNIGEIVDKLIDTGEIEALDWYFVIKDKILDKALHRFSDQDFAILIKHIMNLDFEAVYEFVLSKYGGSKAINKRLTKLAENSSIFMCVPGSTFTNIITGTEPEIKSGVETKRGGDTKAKDVKLAQRRIATEIIKMKSDPTDFNSFNKYGFVSTKNYPYPDDAIRYGAFILEFSDHVKERATVCVGDSFQAYNPVMPFDNLDIDNFACNLLPAVIESTSGNIAVFIANLKILTSFLENMKSGKQGLNIASLLYGSGLDRGYIEAQIKGTLTIEDIKTVYLPSSVSVTLFNLLQKDQTGLPDHLTFAVHNFADRDTDINDAYLDDIKDRVQR